MSVMISRVASNSIVLPLWRRLETTGYFTRPPYDFTLASIAHGFTLSRKSRELSGTCRAVRRSPSTTAQKGTGPGLSRAGEYKA
jgi:hypothetical protein